MKSTKSTQVLKPRDAYGLVYPSGNETWHTVRAIAEHGEIQFAATYAGLALKSGVARDAMHALQMATAEVERVHRLREDVHLARQAHYALDARRRSGNSPSGFVPTTA